MRHRSFFAHRVRGWHAGAVRGFTLVEVLLAVSLSALLLTVVFTLYFTLARTVDEQEIRRGGNAVARAADRLGRDLMNAWPVPGYTEGGFELAANETDAVLGSVLRFCTARRATPFDGTEEDEREVRWFEVVEVRYWVERAAGGRGRLLRADRSLVGPGAGQPAATNVLAIGVQAFEVKVRQAQEWVDTLVREPDDQKAPWPSAARIRLVPDEATRLPEPHVFDVLIPAGWTFEPPANP